MRTAVLTLMLALLSVGAPPAEARSLHLRSIDCSDLSPPLEWGPRHDPGRARFTMVSEDGDVALLLTRRVVALQFSDRVFGKIDREFEREEDEWDGWLEHAIKSAVIGGVRALLNHSLECPLDELRDVRYRDGRLTLITEDGDRIFEDVKCDDQDVLECFASNDARAFVQEFRRLK